MKTFSALGLKPQALEKGERGEEEGQEKERFFYRRNQCKEGEILTFLWREKEKEKRKKPISNLWGKKDKQEETIKLAKESSSSSKAEDEVFAIGAEPINLPEPTIQQPATRASRPAQKGTIIRELVPQEELAQEEVP